MTLFNCFVMGTIPDDMAGIFENLKEAALTMQQGGGIGYDFSTLRPKGAPVQGVGGGRLGAPVSFMDVWDAMCRTIMSAGSRRGAMMATMRCDHPDIEDFIDGEVRPRAAAQLQRLGPGHRRRSWRRWRPTRPWDLTFDGTRLPHGARRATCGTGSCARPTTTPSPA